MAITILHLSDMQFGKNHRFGIDTTKLDGNLDSLLHRLTEDLEILRDEFEL